MATITSAEPVSSALASGGPAAGASRGISSAEAERRLIQYGANELQREAATSPLVLFARQFTSPVIWLLVGASVVSAALAELLDAIAIATIVIVNAAIGFLQEHRAERAVMALRSMTAPPSRRSGRRVRGASCWPRTIPSIRH